MGLEVYELEPQRTGLGPVIVIVDGVQLGSFGSIEKARSAFTNFKSRQLLKGNEIPSASVRARLKKPFGQRHAVYAVLGAEGHEVGYIVVTPSGIYRGVYDYDVACELAAALATEFDAALSDATSKADFSG